MNLQLCKNSINKKIHYKVWKKYITEDDFPGNNLQDGDYKSMFGWWQVKRYVTDVFNSYSVELN